MEAVAVLGPVAGAFFFLACALLGGLAGFLAGLLGVGGGIVLVPGIYYFLDIAGFESEHLMHVAVGTSLAVIVPTGLSSARAHWKKHAVDLGLVRQIGTGIIMGVLAGTLAANDLSGDRLKVIFAGALIFLSLMMLSNPARFTLVKHMPRQPVPALAGFLIGGLSTLIGIGGATMSVPFMGLCKVPFHRAVGTAAALGLVISIPAALGFILIGLGEEGRPPLSLGFVNIPAWLLIVPASVTTAPLGARLAHFVSVDFLRRIFAVFMILVAFKMAHGLLT